MGTCSAGRPGTRRSDFRRHGSTINSGSRDCPIARAHSPAPATRTSPHQFTGRRLAKDDPHPYFIHWMTLNSHLPVLVPSTLASGAPCSPALSLSPNTALCSWYQLVANVHQSVSGMAMSGLGRPTVFVIVGDHTPPFVEPAVRDRFSRSVVPYVLLIPRPNNGSSRIGCLPAALPHRRENRPGFPLKPHEWLRIRRLWVEMP